MPRPHASTKGDKPLLPWIVRRVEVIRGKLDFRLECFPAFDYARKAHKTYLEDDENCLKDPITGTYRKKAVFSTDDMTIELRSVTGCNANQVVEGETPYPKVEFTLDTTTWPGHKGPGVVAEFSLLEGQTVDFVLREDPKTVGMVAGVPESKLSYVNKAPVQDRDGARVISKMFGLGDIDPFLDPETILTLQEAVSFLTLAFSLPSNRSLAQELIALILLDNTLLVLLGVSQAVKVSNGVCRKLMLVLLQTTIQIPRQMARVW